MSTVRIALANVEFPATPDESIRLAEDAIAQASTAGADIICFPECFVPGYRGMGKQVAPPDAEFLERAWSLTAKAAAKGNIAVVLGTERVVNDGLRISVLVINRDGTIAGFQDKVQLDPGEEEDIYSPGSGRRVFHTGVLTFGIAICHEGFRYPETVRWAVHKARSWCSILISMKPNLQRTSLRPMQIRRIRFTKRRRCAAPRRTPAFSQPSTVQAEGRARRPLSCGLMELS